MEPVRLGPRVPPPEAAVGVEDDSDGALGDVVVADEEVFVKTAYSGEVEGMFRSSVHLEPNDIRNEKAK